MITIEQVQDTVARALAQLGYEQGAIPPKGMPAITDVTVAGEGVAVTFADGTRVLLAIIMRGPPPPDCLAPCPGEPGYRCTEPAGHAGDHVADGSAPLVTWPQDAPPPAEGGQQS